MLLMSITQVKAGDFEDYTWWNKTHNWDGITPWINYLKTTSAFFGPNALPVATMNKGMIQTRFSLEFRPEFHYSQADKTTDLYTSLKIPFAKRVDFEAFIVPIEYFTLDSATRYIRSVRHIDASGVQGGDFWFGTNFKLVKQTAKRPDIIASFYFKSASGTGLDYARFTDAPGYYVNFAFGKDLKKKSESKQQLRIYGQAGFFAYQTWDYLHNQNDCILYGIGLASTSEKYSAFLELAGYLGYMELGDSPLLIRSQLKTNTKRAINYAINLQSGLHDFAYHSVGISIIYSFGKTLED